VRVPFHLPFSPKHKTRKIASHRSVSGLEEISYTRRSFQIISSIEETFVAMPSRLAVLKLAAGNKIKKSGGPSRQAVFPRVEIVRDAGGKAVLERSNTLLSTTSSATAVSTSTGSKRLDQDKVVLQLAAGAELPSVPYKLRFALSPQEWDERMERIARHREQSAQPFWEVLWFFLILTIPAAAVYPLYMSLLASITSDKGKKLLSAGQDPTVVAGLITIGVVMLLAIMLATPLFVRKYVLQRRVNKDADQWAKTDRRKTDEPDPDVRWRVRLPNIFCTSCQLLIPVPPRKRTISLEAALEKDKMTSLAIEESGVALSRVSSNASQRSMFDD
jgi:hypothetical protein